MNWKDFLYFQRGEQVAITLLAVLILLGILLNITLCSRISPNENLLNDEAVTEQIEAFRSSLQERDTQAEAPAVQRIAEQDDAHQPVQRVTQLQPTTATSANRVTSTTTTAQSATIPRTPRLAMGETISLNESDTTRWMLIPGIGTVFSNRIVRYQERLGGFASIDQLLEVNGITEDLFARITPYISHYEITIQQLDVNRLEFSDLLRHPYLEFEQVQVIMNLRRRAGNISGIEQLAMMSEFSAEDIERLRPYLAF